MQIAQRTLLIVTIIGVLMFFGVAINYEKEEKAKRQWEMIQTEKFLQHINRNQRISLEEYLQYVEAIKLISDTSEITIEEYRKEWDMKGEIFYFLVSWEEIKECFLKENNCVFEDGSVIRIEICRRSRNKSTKNEYYVIASGKE